MPIKRQEFLKPFSREHHHNLLLCWKIRAGISKGIDFERIKKYTDWFFETHILPHFKLEEKYIFPILGKEHELVKKALSEHRRLKRLFTDDQNVEKSLSLIEEELVSHVRFEERVLFREIQKYCSAEEMESIESLHLGGKFVENTDDEFWM
ncbi:MAG TPA: hemerythrin domain-containing protein [Flavobacteriaceae bacterium]|nr:hemerythrin domain-containing protein [Flavobacteriaceae bacterium]